MKLGFINPLNVSLNGLIDTIKVTLFVVKFDIFKFLKKYFLFFNIFFIKVINLNLLEKNNLEHIFHIITIFCI